MFQMLSSVSDHALITSNRLSSVHAFKLCSTVLQTSSTASANALDVKNYLDWFANMSSKLLEYVVNMVDTDVSII
jgi:hypothetical protein